MTLLSTVHTEPLETTPLAFRRSEPHPPQLHGLLGAEEKRLSAEESRGGGVAEEKSPEDPDGESSLSVSREVCVSLSLIFPYVSHRADYLADNRLIP